MARPELSRALAGVLAASVITGVLTALPAHAISGGTAATDGAHGYTAYVRVGTKTCSGVLVDQQWVLTAARCFGAPGQVRPGAPAERTVVTVGRTKLAHGSGEVVEVQSIATQTGRDVVLAKLADPVADVAPVPLPGAAGFTTGEQLTVTGYGALAATSEDEDRLHSAAFALGAVTGKELTFGAATPTGADLCSGDLGGPVLRQRDGALELGGIITSAKQRNCLGETEQTASSAAERVDDLAAWIKENVAASRANPAVADSGIVELTNNITGGCLSGDTTATCGSGRSAQEFELLGAGEHKRLRNLHSRQCLGIDGNSLAPQACDANNPAQGWALLPGKGGTVQLVNQQHKKPLTVPELVESTKPVLRTNQPYAYQLWRLTAKGKARHDLPQRGSLKATNEGLPDHYLRHGRGEGWLNLITANNPDLDKADATFRLVPGLANADCYSFEASNIPGAYLRHQYGRVRLDDRVGGGQFDADATWCARDGLSGTGVSFAALNFPDNYLRHIRGEVWSAYKGGAQWYENPNFFEPDSSWVVAPPLKP